MYCFLCKKNNFQLVYKLKSKNILRCKNDGLFISESTTARRNKLYKEDYFNNPPHPANFNRKYFLKKIEIIKLMTDNRKPKTLNVGCGWGDFEEVLEKEKIPYLGIDTSKEAIKICQKKGLNCIHSDLNQLNYYGWPKWKGSRQRAEFFQPAAGSSTGGKEISVRTHYRFDAITLFQVIEHLNNPLPLLQSAKKLLKKNGVILITTPNNNSPLRKIFGPRWSVYNDPSHFIFFNKTTLRKTLQMAGWEDINVINDSPRYLSLSYILNRLNLKSSNISYLTSNIAIPTDPFGDLEATALMNYD